MKKQNEDRRIQKTRTALKNALLELLNEKNIQEISIAEVSERANINRGTYYLHYPDVFSLLEEIENEYLKAATNVFGGNGVSYENVFAQRDVIMVKLLDFFYQNQKVTSVLLMDRGRVIFHTKFKQLLWDKISEPLLALNYANDDFFRYYILYIISGVVGVIQEWVKNDFNITPEVMSANIQRLMSRKSYTEKAEKPEEK